MNTAGVVEKFDAALQQAKTKLYKVMMPSFLNKHPRSIFCILPQELINYIRDLQLQLEFSSSHSWYQHRIKNDLDNSGQEIIDYMKMNKYFLPVQKRKAEDDLEENGRNKRMRIENQGEQKSTYFRFGDNCPLQ